MPTNASIDAAVDTLNRYSTTYSNDIKQKLRTGLEFETMMTPRAADHTYSAPNVTATELLQPWQSAYTPKGSYAFSAVENELTKIKLDHTVTADDLEVFWDSWKVEWNEFGKDPMTWSFPRYLFEQIFIPKLQEELNKIAWAGEYVAPTPGTAGGYLTSVDGYHTKIKDAVLAGDLTEYATGALVEATMVQQIEDWIDSLPVPYRDRPGQIVMSKTNAKRYYRNYRSEFGYGAGVSGNSNEELRVDATNKTIVGLDAIEGSNRIFFSPATLNNVIWGTRRGFPTYFNMTFEQDTRNIKMFGDIYRFFGFEFWQHLFVNDQE